MTNIANPPVQIGDKFGRLRIIASAAPSLRGKLRWLCRCNCGTRKIVREDHLKAGSIRSCRCLSGEIAGARTRTHGLTGTREHRIWKNLRNRALNPNNQSYERYGGRGINVCERWNSFENFLADMGPCPENFSIERKDNNGDYCPENCKWASGGEQARNRGNNRQITIGPTTMAMGYWTDIYGMSPAVVSRRIRRGWTPLKALTVPVYEGSLVRLAEEQGGVLSCL